MNRAVTLTDRLKSAATYLDVAPEKRPQSWRQLMQEILRGKVYPRDAIGLAQSCGVMADEPRKPGNFVKATCEFWELAVVGHVQRLIDHRGLSEADRDEIMACADEADEWERVRDDQLSEDHA